MSIVLPPCALLLLLLLLCVCVGCVVLLSLHGVAVSTRAAAVCDGFGTVLGRLGVGNGGGVAGAIRFVPLVALPTDMSVVY